jgi:hypothetical protein
MPDGPRSPLRTAKRAWAAIQPGATHHVVMQDDVVPVDHFADHLLQVLRLNPMTGTALATIWTSPKNSYLVRRAAIVGHNLAQLSEDEWTPTLGLALPVQNALGLASYLSRIPDSLRDDDQVISRYIVAQHITIYVTIPHILANGEQPSLTGHDGYYPATILCPVSADSHWQPKPSGGAVRKTRYTLDFWQSRCRFHFVDRWTAEEPFQHKFGWYWYDWCCALGSSPERIIDLFVQLRKARRIPGDGPVHLLAELWALGFLIGADIMRNDMAISRWASIDLQRAAIKSWLDIGLRAADRARLGSVNMTRLPDTCLAGVAYGIRESSRFGAQRRAGRRNSASTRTSGSHGGLALVIANMSRREVAVQASSTPRMSANSDDEMPGVTALLIDCPWCGRKAAHRSDLAPPFYSAADGDCRQRPTLKMLACEDLTARAILPILNAVENSTMSFQTRASAWASLMPDESDARAILGALRAIDSAEHWAGFPEGGAARCLRLEDFVLPSSTRTSSQLSPCFIKPHLGESMLERIGCLYDCYRRKAVRRAFET